MCGNIGPNQVNTCPVGMTIDIYDTSYPGNGDCRSGFGAARNVYGITRPVDWIAASFEIQHCSCTVMAFRLITRL